MTKSSVLLLVLTPLLFAVSLSINLFSCLVKYSSKHSDTYITLSLLSECLFILLPPQAYTLISSAQP